MLNEMSKLLTEETAIIFTDGTVIKGAREVSEFIVRCNKMYTLGYITGLARLGMMGIGVGIGMGVVGFIGYKMINKPK
jgi:ribosomal protein L10